MKERTQTRIFSVVVVVVAVIMAYPSVKKAMFVSACVSKVSALPIRINASVFCDGVYDKKVASK